MPQTSPTRVLRFGVFEVNLSARELRKHGIRVRLPGQPFCVLSILLERPGDVFTREEIQQKLWASDTFVDFEHSLNSAIKKLRSALGDTPENSRYIETLPRVGYRFVAPVEEVSGEEGSKTSAPASAPGILAKSEEPGSSLRWLAVPVGIGVVLSVAALGAYLWFHSWTHVEPPAGRLMLAVLPFENLTGDAGQEYLSDGLTDEMIAQLGRLSPEHLGVIARTSVMYYKHSGKQVEKIGRELGVQYVLEGSVRRDAKNVRITAELVQVKDQTRVWAGQYDRELSNLLALQGEIAQQIANEIRLTLDDHKRTDSAQRPSASPTSYEAYDLYLKGRYFWNKRTPQGFQRAIECFQQALAKDPSYARAYAGLADSYALMSGYTSVPAKEFMPKGRAAALRAVQLDDQLAETHTSLAVIAQDYDWDWQTAEKEYLRAIQLDPNYATAHHWYAEYLALVGRFDEAFVEIERARQLDPLSLIIAADHGAILYFSRDYDRAIEQFRTVLDMEPNFPRAQMVVSAYLAKGSYAEALADLEKSGGADDAPWLLSALTYVYGHLGRVAEARRALRKLQEVNRRRQIDPLAIAQAYIGLDDEGQAFAWLEKACLEHSASLTALKVDPIYDPLRSDPRFQTLLRRVGLAQ